MPHRTEHSSAERRLGDDEAYELAATLKAIGSPPRLHLLTELLASGRTVEELASAAGLSLSGASITCGSCAICGSCAGVATGAMSAMSSTTTTSWSCSRRSGTT